MLPGPTIIRKCQKCSGLIGQFTILSGNTIGATFWTDGKMDAPMLPDMLWFVKCPHCQELLWIDELEEVGRVESFRDENTFRNVKPYQVPEFQDYLSELGKSLPDKEKEQYLRFRAWWAGNDKRREGRNENKSPLSDEEKENLNSLFELLDSAIDTDRLIMAEIKRELEQFEDAEALLSEPFDEISSQAVSTIAELVRKREPFVAKLEPGG